MIPMTAEERIAQARADNLTELDLSGLGLTALPDSLFQFPSLRSLNLSFNRLTALPDSLAQLSNLQSLDLNNNRLTVLSDSLGELSSLESLSLWGNNLRIFHKSIAQLTQLRLLDVSRNRFEVFPEGLASLSNLQSLFLSDGDLFAFPDSICHLSNLRVLDMGGNELTTLSNSFGQLLNLQYLDLRGNKLKNLPDSFADMADLHYLNLYGNRLTALPDSFAKLSNLSYLNCSRNKFTIFPLALVQLSKLQSLYMAENLLADLPFSLVKLQNLQTLDLCENRISGRLDFLADLTGLRSLDLSENALTDLPDSLARLSCLESLELSGNRLTTLPASIAQLSNLQSLALSGNRLSVIPQSLCRLPNLKKLFLRDNPLTPEWQAAIQAGQQLEYLRSLAKPEVNSSPRTVKLILLGEPKAGKTTLREALSGNHTPCDPNRPETTGVDIVTVDLAHSSDPEPIHLNIWDFAGQHVEHSTHQFFLTEGAIYLILWNSRLGADSGKRDIYYWLELLRMKVPSARFLLVATHADRTPPDLDYPRIQSLAGDSFAGRYDVDFASLNGFEPLRDAIAALAAASSSMRSLWNRRWLAFRDHIRQCRQARRYLTRDAFFELMREYKIEDPGQQTALAAQLHELGEILFHRDIPHLSDIVLLDCEWVTELLGLVTRSHLVRENQGALTRAQLDTLWPSTLVPLDLRPHLLALMDQFDLSYAAAHDAGLSIVVQALPPYNSEPFPQWDAAADLPELGLVYEFPNLFHRLPPGIPAWAFARAHQLAVRTPWRNRMMLLDDGGGLPSTGQIFTDEQSRKVHLRVRSAYPDALFHNLRRILEYTFQRWPGLQVKQFVPCRCAPACPGLFPYDFLMKKVAANSTEVDCQVSSQSVPIAALLSGLSHPSPAPTSPGAIQAQLTTILRLITSILTHQRTYHQSTCPNIFEFHPLRQTALLEDTLEYLRNGETWRLTLYCDTDEVWHRAPHADYDIELHADWIESLRAAWNPLAGFLKRTAPLLKAIGKADPTTSLEAAGHLVDWLPQIPVDHRGLLKDSPRAERAELIDIAARHTLTEIIATLDAARPAAHRNGGLHKTTAPDGRTLWLCPHHHKKLYPDNNYASAAEPLP